MAKVEYNGKTPPVCTIFVSCLYIKSLTDFLNKSKKGEESKTTDHSEVVPLKNIFLRSDDSVEKNTCILYLDTEEANNFFSSSKASIDFKTENCSNDRHNNISNQKLISTDFVVAQLLSFLTNSFLNLCGDLPDLTCKQNPSVKEKSSSFLIDKCFSSQSFVNSAEFDFWLDFSNAEFDSTASYMAVLNKHLQLRTFFVGRSLTLVDICIFARIEKDLNKACAIPPYDYIHSFPPSHSESLWKNFLYLGRWYHFIRQILHASKAKNATNKNEESITKIKTNMNTTEDKTTSSEQRASYEGKLQGAEMGKVVVRFPPEPSGYLHIGHAKAALLNSYFAKLYHGKLIVRFDDTNPAKESMEFENSIMEDLKILDVHPDKITRTSNYFDALIEYGKKFILEGNAYVDDTPLEVMRDQRMKCIESKCRNQDIQTNLKMWNEMIKGSELGLKYCMRGKINMNDKNGSMRDPVFFRCIVDIPHHHFQFKYKVYPTYDFACPIVDSLEGVTHAMRTSEYSDRIPQYKWVLEKAGCRDVCIYEFSRLNFVRTVLSKRKLTWFVQQGIVEGWDDPRFPTVRGIVRRGLKVEALLKFLLDQGPSKSINLMEWDKLWTINKQIIDPVVRRYIAVGEESVELEIKDGPQELIIKERFFHNKNESLGKTYFSLFNKILIEKDDANLCTEGEEIGLMRWDCAVIDKIVYDEKEENEERKIKRIEAHLNPSGDIRKTKKKLHWLANKPENLVNVTLREYDHLLTIDKPDSIEENLDFSSFVNKNSIFDSQAIADVNILELEIGEIVQLERRGYFRVDKKNHQDKMILIKIPDGKSRSMSCISTKVNAMQFGAKSDKKGKKNKI